MFHKSRRRSSLRSFSLLETMLVLALVAIVVAMVMEGYSAMIQSTTVTTSAAMVADVLTQARASAIAQNTTVEVRIYDVPPASGGAPVYDAMQLHWLNANKTSPPVASPLLLSSWVVIDPTATYSPLIALNQEPLTPDPADTRLNSQTRVFHFLPDGSTDLSPATNWFMTVRPVNQANPGQIPSNWACIRVDATTGRPQIYRP